MREECEVALGEAEQRRCKPGGRFPEGLIKQVAAARIAQPRAVEERLNRRQGHVLALPAVGQVALETVVVEDVMTEEGAAGRGAAEGAVAAQEEERMVWTVLGGDGPECAPRRYRYIDERTGGDGPTGGGGWSIWRPSPVHRAQEAGQGASLLGSGDARK